VLAANTSFADFPRLASFHAGDEFFPRQFTKKGHRGVFSTGIIMLAVAATVLVVITGANVSRLIPLYAIGVFTSFTLSQAGMAKHHITHKQVGWRRGLVVNSIGAVMSAIVDVIIALTKFKPPGGILGAWVIVIAVPIIVYLLARTNKIYAQEERSLGVDIRDRLAPPYPRHRVVILVEDFDRAAIDALQYARQLRPLSTVALHAAVDLEHAHELMEKWARADVPFELEIVECPDRNLVGTIASHVREIAAQPGTQVTVLIPVRRYLKPWHRVLHDATSRALIRRLGRIPNAHVTIVPFALKARPVLRAVDTPS